MAATATPDIASARKHRLKLERSIYQNSLADFVRLVWPILHPKTPLIWNWPMQAICDHLQAVTDGKIRRLLINCPPGFSKSLLCNVFWPAWEWGPRETPHLQYISWAYKDTLTIRDNRRCRQILEHEIYQRLWGDVFELSADQNTKTRYDNNHNGFRIATSTGGTGERGDRNIIDDMHSVAGAESDAKRAATLEWLTTTLPTRVNDPTKTAFVYIGQRIHAEDGPGHLLSHNLIDCHLLIDMHYAGMDHPVRKEPGWIGSTIGYEDPRKVIGELACPERFPEDEVKKLELVMESHSGPYAALGQLEQAPIHKTGGMFSDDWWQIKEAHEVPKGSRERRAWDFAGSKRKTSPYTASARGKLVGGILYITDMTCDRWEAAELENNVVDQAEADGRAVVQDWPQDPGQAGKAQVSSMAKRLHGYDHHASPESGEKSVRASPVAAQAKRGNVVLVRGPWNKRFIAEARLFPRSTFKDQVDAVSRLHAGLVANATTEPDGGWTGDDGTGSAETSSTLADESGSFLD